MRVIRRIVLAAILLCLAIAGALTPSCRNGAPAKQVVVYCSADQAFAEPILKEFERTTGIRVVARFDTEAGKTVGLVQRLRAEAAAPAADVFWSGEIFHTIRLAQDGLLEGNPEAAKSLEDWPAQYIDAQHRWYGFAPRARVIAYSRTRVRPEEVPTKLEDLLLPHWKGRVTMADPRFGTTGGDVASWFAHLGEARAMEILRGLEANDIRVAAGNSDAVRLVVNGQADAAMTDTDDVYVAQQKGLPIDLCWLDRGGAGTLTIPNTVAVIHGGPNPVEARKLVDWLLSATVEAKLAESDSHNCPVRPEVRARFRQYEVPRVLPADYGRIAELLPSSIQKAGEVLGG